MTIRVDVDGKVHYEPVVVGEGEPFDLWMENGRLFKDASRNIPYGYEIDQDHRNVKQNLCPVWKKSGDQSGKNLHWIETFDWPTKYMFPKFRPRFTNPVVPYHRLLFKAPHGYRYKFHYLANDAWKNKPEDWHAACRPWYFLKGVVTEDNIARMEEKDDGDRKFAHILPKNPNQNGDCRQPKARYMSETNEFFNAEEMFKSDTKICPECKWEPNWEPFIKKVEESRTKCPECREDLIVKVNEDRTRYKYYESHFWVATLVVN